jgi:hypothetical protein
MVSGALHAVYEVMPLMYYCYAGLPERERAFKKQPLASSEDFELQQKKQQRQRKKNCTKRQVKDSLNNFSADCPELPKQQTEKERNKARCQNDEEEDKNSQ